MPLTFSKMFSSIGLPLVLSERSSALAKSGVSAILSTLTELETCLLDCNDHFATHKWLVSVCETTSKDRSFGLVLLFRFAFL